MKPITFYAHSDIVVIGQDSEMVDYDNPRGYIHGFRSYVIAEDAVGNRRSLTVRVSGCEDEAMTPATRMAEALNARLAGGKLPVAFGQWSTINPAYGSLAYQQYGAEEDLAWERKMVEEEIF